MTIREFIDACGCSCFDGSREWSQIVMPDGRKVYLHPGIDCHTTTTLVRGAGPRPRVARRRRPWLRARRRAMRHTGRPPQDASTTYVHCRGCGVTGETADHLEGTL